MELEGRKGGRAEGGDGTAEIIGACIEVHRVLGPGLLESIDEECPFPLSPSSAAPSCVADVRWVEVLVGASSDAVEYDGVLASEKTGVTGASARRTGPWSASRSALAAPAHGGA